MTTSHAATLAALRTRLDEACDGSDREALKADIIALYKAVDAQMAGLAVLRDGIRTLAERWKNTRPAATVTPEFTVARPVVHADHIGASTFVERGWSLLSFGDYAAAEQALTHAIELSPDDPNAEALLGWAMMLQEKHDDALVWFQRVLMREPHNALARINVGYICLKKRIFGEAIEHLSRAIRLDNDKKATLYAHFYLGLVYLEREMFQDARSFFEDTIRLGPNFIEAYYELGRALLLSGRAAEARKAWQEGYAANRMSPWGRRCLEAATSTG